MSNGDPQVFDAAAFAVWAGGDAQALPAAFRGVTQDTRQVTPGCLYVALRGERFDGHDFVAQAFQNGAAAALVERAWRAPDEAAGWPLVRVPDTRRALADAARAWRRRQPARIVGITGSSGKTTVKEMAAALCGGGGPVCATRGNLNNEIGLPLSLLTLGAETAYGIFEAGTNHPGEIAGLADVLRPDIAIIASIGCAHIEHFGSLEAIEGYVPTVRGTVRVGVRQTPGVRYAVTVEVPVNTTARVELPWRGGVTLLMDGKAVAARVDGGRFVVDGVSSGRHTLSWQSEEEAACGSSFGGRVRKIVGCGWRSWVPFF